MRRGCSGWVALLELSFPLFTKYAIHRNCFWGDKNSCCQGRFLILRVWHKRCFLHNGCFYAKLVLERFWVLFKNILCFLWLFLCLSASILIDLKCSHSEVKFAAKIGNFDKNLSSLQPWVKLSRLSTKSNLSDVSGFVFLVALKRCGYVVFVIFCLIRSTFHPQNGTNKSMEGIKFS